MKRFLSTPSARRATDKVGRDVPEESISIHALREEGDGILSEKTTETEKFLSTPSARRATFYKDGEVSAEWEISIHALREEGDRTRPTRASNGWNFYPRPPRGGRQKSYHDMSKAEQFLSTPSARRATHESSAPCTISTHFYPRPPRGGRQVITCASADFTDISIHALREEGDPACIALFCS